MNRTLAASVTLLVTVLLAGCAKSGNAVPAVQPPAFQLTASIQDIMHGIVDPAADALWDSVGTEVTHKGEVHNQPRSVEQWNAVRNSAIALTEASNLLIMDGRQVVHAGKEVEDAHVTGIQSASEIQAEIAKDRQAWIGFAQALHATGEQALQAIDAQDATRLLHAGEALDEVCEACHLKYWYPGQVIPSL